MRAGSLEQVFLQRRGGVFQVLLVFETEAGERHRVTLSAPHGDEAATVDFVARYLRQEGARLATRPRLRVESAGSLRDAPELLERLTTALARRTGGGVGRI